MHKDAELGSVLMLEHPVAAAAHACTVCGGNGRVGIIRESTADPVSVDSCPQCNGTGKVKQRAQSHLQFNLRTLLISASVIPPVLAWGVWLVSEMNPLGCIFSVVPVAFYAAVAAFSLLFRRTRWYSVLSMVLCAASVSLVMPASSGSEFLEVGLAVALLSTIAGAAILAIAAIGYFVTMFHRSGRLV